MGSCLSKRKRMSDAAVTHNASPRTSFSLASKEPAHAKVSVINKDSERNCREETTGRSALMKKSKNKKASQQESNDRNDQKRSSSASSLPSLGISEGNSSHNSPVVISRADSQVKAVDSTAPQGDAAASCNRMEPRSPSLLSSLSPPSSPHPKAIAGAVSDPLQGASRPSDEGINLPVSRTSKKRVLFQSLSENSQACGYIQEYNVQKAEELEEEEEEEGRPPPASKLKRSRSCEHSMRLDVKRPLRRITFQEDVAEVLSKVHHHHQKSNKSNSAAALLQSSNSKSSFHGESRCSKFLEGLDLIDILPSKPVVHNLLEQLSDSHEEEFLLHDNHQPEDPGRISADFFELKQRYLSSRSANCFAEAPSQKDDLQSDKNLDHAADGTISFLNMHSRASSIDSVEPELYSLHKHRLFTALAEEEGCESDDSETFEFNQAVSLFSREGELKRQERLNTQSIAEEGEGEDDDDDDDDEDEKQEDVDKYQVVATGDAVLVSGTNSEEFHLIPSRAYFESNNRNQHHHHHQPHHRKLEQQQQQQQQKKGSPLGRMSPSLRTRSGSSSPPAPPSSYLSVDEIICLLERDELDEEVLLSLLRCGGGGPGDGGGGGGTVCASGGTPTSEVASEASFEFKAGSTPPHSTPSTPMLSAGSTPTRQQGPASYINQLSPIALTPEEIAEIWGVFEQRQAISLA